MILSRNCASSLLLGAVAAALAISGARAEDGSARTEAGRCSDFGAGYIDMGNGTCGRIGGHVRVPLGARTASQNGWNGVGTSNAAMRSYDTGAVPAAGASPHLRVRSGLAPLSPFR